MDWDAHMTTDLRQSRLRHATPYARRSSANRRDDLVRKSQQKRGHKIRVLEHRKKLAPDSDECDSPDAIVTCTRIPLKATLLPEDDWEVVHLPDKDARTTLLRRFWHWVYCR